MKIKIKFRPMRNAAGKPVRIIQLKERPAGKPGGKLKRAIWKGLRIHEGSWKSFRELLQRRANAPFHFALPGLRAGKG
jgi:hypothetical protein